MKPSVACGGIVRSQNHVLVVVARQQTRMCLFLLARQAALSKKFIAFLNVARRRKYVIAQSLLRRGIFATAKVPFATAILSQVLKRQFCRFRERTASRANAMHLPDDV